MVEEKANKAVPEASSDPPAPVEPVDVPKDVAEEKTVIPHGPPDDKKADDCSALVIVQKPEAADEKKPEGSIERDAVLARVATDKRLSLIKAWEESKKSKAENKAQKKLSAILARENSEKASLEAEIKKFKEQLEKQKAEFIEKTKNKIALIHKAAEEKRARIEAKRGEDALMAEEMAAKYRATGTAPKKRLGRFLSR